MAASRHDHRLLLKWADLRTMLLPRTLPTNNHPYHQLSSPSVSAGSPSRGGDVTVYVWHKPTELVSFSLFVALSTVLHSINSPDNSLFSHSVLPVLCLLYWFYVFLWKSPYMVVCVCCEIFQLCCRNVVVGFKWLVCRVTERWIKLSFEPWYNP